MNEHQPTTCLRLLNHPPHCALPSIMSCETLSFLTSHHATNPINFACAHFSRFSAAFCCCSTVEGKTERKKENNADLTNHAHRHHRLMEMARYFFSSVNLLIRIVFIFLIALSHVVAEGEEKKRGKHCTLFTLYHDKQPTS